MYKNFLKKIKKLFYCLILIQRKKIFIISIIIFTILYVSKTFLKNQNMKIEDIGVLNKIYNIKNNNNTKDIFNFMEKLKILIENKKFKEVTSEINNNLDSIKDENIKNILYIKLSRIFLFNKDIDLSFNILKKIKNNSWLMIKYDLLAESFLIKNKKQEALSIWKKSLLLSNNSNYKEIIEMKINNIDV